MLEFQNRKKILLKDRPKKFLGEEEEVFVVSKIKNTVPWTYAISDLNGESITGSFYEKELQKKKENTDHDHDKYITTSELNTLATTVVNTKITQANLAKKKIDNEVLSLDGKIAANKTKNEFIGNELQKLKQISTKSDVTILSFFWYN